MEYSDQQRRTITVSVNIDVHVERIGQALTLLSEGLRPFITVSLQKIYGKDWYHTAYSSCQLPLKLSSPTNLDGFEIRYLLQIIIKQWNEVFQNHTNLQPNHRNLVHEIRSSRNEWAHQVKFSNDETYRVLDNIERLLKGIGSTRESVAVNEIKKDVLLDFAEEVRIERLDSKRRSNKPIEIDPNLSHISVRSSELESDMMDL